MLNSINMVVMDNTRGYEAVTIDQELTGKTRTYSYTMFNDTTCKLYKIRRIGCIVVLCCVVYFYVKAYYILTTCFTNTCSCIDVIRMSECLGPCG